MGLYATLTFRCGNSDAYRLSAFHLGLKEGGFVKGENVVVDYRWAESGAPPQ